MFGQFIYCIYKHKELPNAIKRIEKSQYWLEEINKSGAIKKFNKTEEATAFDGSELVKKIQDKHIVWRGELGLDNSVLYFDAVHGYSIKNDYIFESFFQDYDSEWWHDYKSSSEYSKKDVSNLYGEKFKKNSVIFDDSLELEHKILTKEFNYRIFERVCDANTIVLNDNWYMPIVARNLFKELKHSKQLDINKLINVFYYNSSVVLDINNKAKKYSDLYYYYRENEAEAGEIPIFTDEIKRNYMRYLKPILVRYSIFDINIYHLNVEDKAYNKCLYMFISEALPLCMDSDNMTDEVKIFQELLQKYVRDKYVSVLPSGLYIHDSRMTRDENALFILYDEDEIDLSQISSGEKKLIIIFALMVFGDYDFLLLDEPELSLSLVWQKNLFSDWLNYGRKTKLLAATHSPYIVSEESIRSFAIYLPQTEK